jgi:fructuronate reductase
MKRLSVAHLGKLPSDVARPLYDRRALSPGVLHLGNGAFHRCHLAEHTDDALHARFGPWGIRAVNLAPPDLGPMLDPQDGLYIRELREGAARDRRVIGALLGNLTVTGPDSLRLALDWATDPATRLVTMTVTEKGYCHIPATGQLDETHPDIAHDLAHPQSPRSVPGFVLATILARRSAGIAPVAFLSCDNVPGNGATLRRCVLALARATVPDAATWIEDMIAFPDTMVDRIVPATRPEDVVALSEATGLTDRALVIGEPFRMWAITRDPRMAHPDWEAAGALIVADVEPYEILKMRVVNGMQTGLCHLGHLAGHEFMSDVMADPVFAAFAARTAQAEVAPHLPPVVGVDAQDYIALTLRRLQNTALRHATSQIATDGSRKIRQRLLEPLAAALMSGQSAPGLTLAVAGWMAHLRHIASLSEPRPVSDPMLPAVIRATETSRTDSAAFVAELLAFEQVFPRRIAELPGLSARLASLVEAIRRDGARATLARHIEAPQ